MKTPKPVKPLIKDYKKAVSFLTDHLDIELKYTKSGSLSIESVGYMKGYFRLGIGSNIQDVLESLVEAVCVEYNLVEVSATDLALYFRNEREEIKNQDQRIDIVSRVSHSFGFLLLDGIQPIETPTEVIFEADENITQDVPETDGFVVSQEDEFEIETREIEKRMANLPDEAMMALCGYETKEELYKERAMIKRFQANKVAGRGFGR